MLNINLTLPQFKFSLPSMFSGVTQSALNVLGTEVNKKVRPGQNVTLHCDHVWIFGYHIYWFRNCSHYKQPPFIMSSEFMMKAVDRKIFRYAFQWNPLRSSHDLVIVNITESDLGLYYCSVSKTNVVDKGVIDAIQTHRFSNITYKLSFEGKIIIIFNLVFFFLRKFYIEGHVHNYFF